MGGGGGVRYKAESPNPGNTDFGSYYTTMLPLSFEGEAT